MLVGWSPILRYEDSKFRGEMLEASWQQWSPSLARLTEFLEDISLKDTLVDQLRRL
jgi:hypothetical protein